MIDKNITKQLLYSLSRPELDVLGKKLEIDCKGKMLELQERIWLSFEAKPEHILVALGYQVMAGENDGESARILNRIANNIERAGLDGQKRDKKRMAIALISLLFGAIGAVAAISHLQNRENDNLHRGKEINGKFALMSLLDSRFESIIQKTGKQEQMAASLLASRQNGIDNIAKTPIVVFPENKRVLVEDRDGKLYTHRVGSIEIVADDNIVKEYLDEIPERLIQIKKLHLDNLSAIRDGNLVLAHELTMKIRKNLASMPSFSLESNRDTSISGEVWFGRYEEPSYEYHMGLSPDLKDIIPYRRGSFRHSILFRGEHISGSDQFSASPDLNFHSALENLWRSIFWINGVKLCFSGKNEGDSGALDSELDLLP